MQSPSPRPAQGFSTGRADAWILTSAVLTAVLYGFRALVTTGRKPVTPFSRWVVGFGAAYTILAVVALGAPELAASLAMIALVGNLLNNGIAVAADLTSLEKGVKP